MPTTLKKFNSLIDRLEQKVRMSATPVKGFVVGLSGTDSIATLILLNEVAERLGNLTILAYHYLDTKRLPAPTSTIRRVERWLFDNCKNVTVSIIVDGPKTDNYRWANMQEIAGPCRLWTVSTQNATEKALGTFSIISNSASIRPIASLYKSEVLAVCEDYEVPTEAITASNIPDCLCGRDEFAAENIRLIDDVLRFNLSCDYSIESVHRAMEYIRETKKENDFKTRTPYNV